MTPPDPTGPARPKAASGWRKYLTVFRISLVERMTYRADFLLGTFLRFVPILTTVLLWRAIFDGAEAKSGTATLGTFSYNEMIVYLLMVNISRMFSSMPGLAGGIARDVREGTLKKYLLQPLEMIPYLLVYRVAHKITYMISSALPYAVLFLICHQFFRGQVPADPGVWLAYLASLVLAFLIGFYFETAVGMVGFWFLEVTSILYIVMTLNFFVSGHMFPLDLIPGFWGDLVKALPFQYMAYFPAVVFLGKIRGPELYGQLALGLAWVAAFWLLSRVLYARGLKRYSAFGG
jgi:ABC-2 type transport system permease protein